MSDQSGGYLTGRDTADERPVMTGPSTEPISDDDLRVIRAFVGETSVDMTELVAFTRLEMAGLLARLDQTMRERGAARAWCQVLEESEADAMVLVIQHEESIERLTRERDAAHVRVAGREAEITAYANDLDEARAALATSEAQAAVLRAELQWFADFFADTPRYSDPAKAALSTDAGTAVLAMLRASVAYRDHEYGDADGGYWRAFEASIDSLPPALRAVFDDQP